MLLIDNAHCHFKDCYTELKKIRDFLELDASDDLIKEIVDSCSVNKMRESKRKQMSEKVAKMWAQVIKPEFNMIRKGLLLYAEDLMRRSILWLFPPIFL